MAFKSAMLMRRIYKLESAASDASWAGSNHSEDRPAIEKALNKARLELVDYVLKHVLEPVK